MYSWSPIRTFKMCIASPILVTGTVKWSQNVNCVSDYCQRLWHMYSCIRSESRRPDVRWHLYILPGNIRYPAEWTGVNVPVVFRMKIKISKPAFHFLFQELFALIYWRIKYLKLKYGLSLLKIHEKYKKYIFRIIFYVSLIKNDPPKKKGKKKTHLALNQKNKK